MIKYLLVFILFHADVCMAFLQQHFFFQNKYHFSGKNSNKSSFYSINQCIVVVKPMSAMCTH